MTSFIHQSNDYLETTISHVSSVMSTNEIGEICLGKVLTQLMDELKMLNYFN